MAPGARFKYSYISTSENTTGETETEPVTDETTDPTTEAPTQTETEAPTESATSTVTDVESETSKGKGCGSVITLCPVAALLLGAVLLKKKED